MSMRLLKRPEVEAKTGKSRSSIYDGVRAGTFPQPVELGPNSVGWIESEIDAWIEQRIAARSQRKLNAGLIAANAVREGR